MRHATETNYILNLIRDRKRLFKPKLKGMVISSYDFACFLSANKRTKNLGHIFLKWIYILFLLICKHYLLEYLTTKSRTYFILLY